MSAYLVKLKGKAELVGFFSASSLEMLWWAIDDVTDPFCCEYKRIANGAIVWESPGEGCLADFGVPEGEEEDDELDGAAMSTSLSLIAHDQNGWRPVDDWRSKPYVQQQD
jgi:hypothetical protein